MSFMHCAYSYKSPRIFVLVPVLCQLGFALPSTVKQPKGNVDRNLTLPLRKDIVDPSNALPGSLEMDQPALRPLFGETETDVTPQAIHDNLRAQIDQPTGQGLLQEGYRTPGNEQSSTGTSESLPKLVKFSGSIPNRSSVVIPMTFSLYGHPEGGSPIWQETQLVNIDSHGDYTVFLGVAHADGITASLFPSNDTRWLGVTPNGIEELPRVLLVSVPYAIRAADADTLDGLPASAFQRVGQCNSENATGETGKTDSLGSTNVMREAKSISASRNFLPIFADPNGGISASTIYQPTPGVVGINTTRPESTFHVVSQTPAVATFQRLRGAKFSIAGYPEGNGGFNGTVVSITNPISSQFRPLVFDVSWLEARINGDNTRSLYLAPNGSVGIGTLQPTARLTVNGNVQILKGGLLFPDGSVQTSAGTSNLNTASFAMINSPNVFTQPQTMPAGLGGLPLPINPNDAATKSYADTSGMVNIRSLGCKGDGVTDDTACLQAMANKLSNTTYFFPAGTYKLTACISIPLATGWHIIGASETGTRLMQTSSTCILKFTKELINHFSIERLEFTYAAAQPAPTDDATDSVAPAILFAPDTHSGGGVFEFEFAHLVFMNGSRGIDIQKKANGAGVANPVWGFNMHDITGGGSLQGATIDLVQGKAQGMPRCGFYNIYNSQTISEPQMSVRYCNSLDFRNIESNNAQNRVYDLTSNYGGIVSGLHIEAHTLLTSNTSIIAAENSDLILKQVDMSSHICPSGVACTAFSLISNGAGGGSIDVEGAYFSPYSGSAAGVASYVLNTSGNSSMTTARVSTARGFTGDFAPGSTVTSNLRQSLRPLEGGLSEKDYEAPSKASAGGMGPSRGVPSVGFYGPTATQSIQSINVTLPASRIESRSCSSIVSVPVSGVRSTSVVLWSESLDPMMNESDPAGNIEIRAWPSDGSVNFRLCNGGEKSIVTKGKVLNVRSLQ
jgi:hypothetical protein